jgi:S-adenosylmethionine hydrolase
VSRTFHGRDIFAPCGAHLAAGVALSELGTPITEIVRKPLPKPEPTETGYRAHILLADVFGNLTTDLPASWVKNRDRVTFSVRGTTIEGLCCHTGTNSPASWSPWKTVKLHRNRACERQRQECPVRAN